MFKTMILSLSMLVVFASVCCCEEVPTKVSCNEEIGVCFEID